MSVGWGQDNNPPKLTYFSFSPDTVNLNSRIPIEFILEGTDDISGFETIYIYLYTEDGTNHKFINQSYNGELQITDSLYTTFEENDPDGIWNVQSIYLYDEIGNLNYLNTNTLEEMGFPTEIFVINDNSDNNPPELTYFNFSFISIL